MTPVIFDAGRESDIGKLTSVYINECNQNSLFGTKKTIKNEEAA